jgi:HD-like signal output (HDOD) protein
LESWLVMSAPSLTRELILDAVWRTDQLPPYPSIVAEVERELAKPDPSPTKVGTILAEDPALSAAILRLANSAFQAARGETTNVAQAVVRLGLRHTRRMVMTAALVQRWPVHRAVNQRSFWNHSVSVALTASEFDKLAGVSIPAEVLEASFTAGILHDLGALVLARAFPEQYAWLSEIAIAEGRGIAPLELDRWGVDHGEVGGIVACRWELPDSLREAVAFHHQPWQARSEHRLLTQLVHVADFLCSSVSPSRTEDKIQGDLDVASWNALGLSVEQGASLFETSLKLREQSKEWVAALR